MRRRTLLAWLPVLLLGSRSGLAMDDETQLKAVILGRFASYIDWPQPSRHDTFTIALLGGEALAATLERIYRQQRIHGKPVRIRPLRHLSELADCDLLYIDLPTAAARRQAIERAAALGILSVGDALGFAELGGVIQLNVVAQNIRVKINHVAAVRAGFRIAAPLLSIATVLREDTP